jgi:hypothetical protein
MIVFDPLAICMVLAFNYLNENKEEQKQVIIDIMKSDEELGLYEDDNQSKSVNDIEVIEPEIVQTEENIDIEIPDYWDSITDEELSEIVGDMLVQERELVMEDTLAEQPQEPAVEDTNDSKPIEEEIKRKAQEEEDERIRTEKQKRLQRSIGGATR